MQQATLDVLLCRAYSIVTSLPEGPKKVMWQMMAEVALECMDLAMLALCHDKMGKMDDALQVRQVGTPGNLHACPMAT